jgi:streptogramin lyase
VAEIPVEEFSGFNLGAYGGAVNGEGDLFFTPMGGTAFVRQLVRVAHDSLAVTIWEVPGDVAPYGITVDHDGRVWTSSTLGAGLARFDPDTETWDTISGFSSLGGLAEGEDDLMWVADSQGLISVNIDDFSFGPRYLGPSKGVSVDVDGFVWSVDSGATKIDPATALEVGSYNGLSGPYTYSDMTGHALGSVTCPPPEG